MGVRNVLLGKRRKTNPCLFFERNTSTSATAPHPDGKELNSNNVVVIEQVRMAVFLAKGQIPRKSMKSRQRIRSSPEELAVRKDSIQHTLKQRRDAISTEIERSWFLQGAHLEKHRHNLQVTHELTIRGLM